jgi:CheY-like chemotaxis protein
MALPLKGKSASSAVSQPPAPKYVSRRWRILLLHGVFPNKQLYDSEHSEWNGGEHRALALNGWLLEPAALKDTVAVNDALRAPVVLIAEDEWLIREEISQEFRHAGWDVLETSSGEACLAVAREERRIDAMVTDIQLGGGVNGWDVADAVRSIKPNLAVVYASGNVMERSRMVPGSAFFAKPCRTAELVETCRRLCHLRRRGLAVA